MSPKSPLTKELTNFGVRNLSKQIYSVFAQTIKLKAASKTLVSGTTQFMACTREQYLTRETVKFFYQAGLVRISMK
jgi:hypothetical protein